MPPRGTGSSASRRVAGAGLLAAALGLAIAWAWLRPEREETSSPRAPLAPAAAEPLPSSQLDAETGRPFDPLPASAAPDAGAADLASRPEAPEPLAPEAAPPAERTAANACSLSIRVVDAPGGEPLTAFEIERAVWQRGLMAAPSRQWISDADGRVEYDGLMCESLVGLRVLAPGRPTKLFGPIRARESALPLELVVGRAAVLRVFVADGGRMIEGAVVSVDRPICDGALVYEHAVWPRVPTDETGFAEITGLVAGHYVVSTTGANRTSDLLELDLQPGVVCEKLLVLCDELDPGRLLVTVVDNDGPVPDQRVRIEAGARAAAPATDDETDAIGVRVGTTDSHGHCSFDRLAPDIYPVTVVGAFGADAHAVVRQRSETQLVLRLVD